jgi:hypothetical protein
MRGGRGRKTDEFRSYFWFRIAYSVIDMLFSSLVILALVPLSTALIYIDHSRGYLIMSTQRNMVFATVPLDEWDAGADAPQPTTVAPHFAFDAEADAPRPTTPTQPPLEPEPTLPPIPADDADDDDEMSVEIALQHDVNRRRWLWGLLIGYEL